MRSNRLKKLWPAGTTFNGWLNIPNGFAAEAMAY